MCKVYAICNQKGGCSKTSVTVNLGIGLAAAGKRVAVIDADPQGSLTISLGYPDPDELPVTLATIMTNIIEENDLPENYGMLHHQEGIELIPENMELSGIEVSLANTMSREMILKEYIEMIRDRFDYILIDCMPSLGVMTINALVAADRVLIPVQSSYLPVKGLQMLLKTISVVKKRLNKQLQIEGILITMVDYRTNYAKDITAMLRESYGMLYSQRCMFWIFTITSSLLWGSMIGVLLKGVTHDLVWCAFFGVVVGVISFVFHMAARLRYYG